MSRYSGTPATLLQMTNGRSLPWLRCGPASGADDPSTQWGIPAAGGGTRAPLYREVVVLNHRNEFLLSFDLASNPIDGATHAAQRGVVREALRTAAALADTDGDHLPDAWEQDEFGSLEAATTDTPTASGLPALLAYGLGQSPRAGIAGRGLQVMRAGGEVLLSHTRRLDRRPNLLWQFEASGDLGQWPGWLDLEGPTVVTRYDGSGTESVSHVLRAQGVALGAFRLKVSVGPDPGD